MNYGKKHDLPFGIMDVAGLLRLNIRRRAPGQVYVDCPICGDRRGKMNLNTEKDLWRCNYCGEGGGMLSLYAKVYGVSNSDAYREICDALAVNGFSPDYAAFMQTEPVDPDDVYQSLAVRLIRAVNSYDPRKGYLEEYILSQLKREMVRIRSTQAVYGLTQAPANIGSTIVSLTIAAQRESYWETYIAV